MARFTSYPNKSKPADSDTLLINDASASANKQILLSGLFAWLKDKFASSTISELETTDKTIVGAINELKEDLDNIEGGGGSGDGLTSEVKDALLAIFQHVAYADDDGQDYYDALEEALYPTVTTRTVSYSLSHVTSSNNASTVTSGASYTATLTASSGYTINTVTVTMGGVDVTSTVYSSGTITIPSVTGNIVITATAVASVSSISAVYTQSGTVWSDDALNSLKSDLVVTATYTGGTTGTIPGTDYTLSGSLAAGTSTITVSYGGKTATFTVTVTTVGSVEYADDLSNWFLTATPTATYSDGKITIKGSQTNANAYKLLCFDRAKTLWDTVNGKKLRIRVTMDSPDWVGAVGQQNRVIFGVSIYKNSTITTGNDRQKSQSLDSQILPTSTSSTYEFIFDADVSNFDTGDGTPTNTSTFGVFIYNVSANTLDITDCSIVEVLTS